MNKNFMITGDTSSEIDDTRTRIVEAPSLDTAKLIFVVEVLRLPPNAKEDEDYFLSAAQPLNDAINKRVRCNQYDAGSGTLQPWLGGSVRIKYFADKPMEVTKL